MLYLYPNILVRIRNEEKFMMEGLQGGFMRSVSVTKHN